MPYPSNAELPMPVRRREEAAHRVAWAAVERQFGKNRDGGWAPNAPAARLSGAGE